MSPSKSPAATEIGPSPASLGARRRLGEVAAAVVDQHRHRVVVDVRNGEVSVRVAVEVRGDHGVRARRRRPRGLDAGSVKLRVAVVAQDRDVVGNVVRPRRGRGPRRRRSSSDRDRARRVGSTSSGLGPARRRSPARPRRARRKPPSANPAAVAIRVLRAEPMGQPLQRLRDALQPDAVREVAGARQRLRDRRARGAALGADAERIRRICEPHFGVGSDGILLLAPADGRPPRRRAADLQPRRLGGRALGQRRPRGGALPARRRLDRATTTFTILTKAGEVTPTITGPTRSRWRSAAPR